MSQINDLQKVEKQLGVLAQKLGRYPNLEEIALSAGISLDRTRNALNVAQTDVAIDMPAYPEDGEPLIASFTDEKSDPAEDYEHVALSQTLR
ncbi:hypothetical protein MK163_19505, partial [bacterium]|nr:hypothetical protein [bacterium]